MIPVGTLAAPIRSIISAGRGPPYGGTVAGIPLRPRWESPWPHAASLALDPGWIYMIFRVSATKVSIVQVAKWGNSLAVRLPAALVRALGLKEGDQIDLVPGDGGLSVVRQPRADEVLEGLRRFRGRLPAEGRLTRDEVHER